MTLIRMLKRIKKETSQHKIVILGPDNAGKTTIIHSITKNTSMIKPTFGYRIHNYSHNNINLVIHDIGGQIALQKYWSNFYEKVDGIIFVFDLCDDREVLSLLNKVIEMNEENVPLLILANKKDLGVSKVKMECKERMKIFKCSALNGENILEGFDWLTEELQRNELKI